MSTQVKLDLKASISVRLGKGHRGKGFALKHKIFFLCIDKPAWSVVTTTSAT